jgi:transcriptional regulator with XRE-family HTH domain
MNNQTGEAAQKTASLILVQSLIGIARANGMPTLQSLADRAGMKRPQLSRYVSGADSPTLETFQRLAKAAGAEIKII